MWIPFFRKSIPASCKALILESGSLRMREARIKINAAEEAAYYHCMSRTVNGESLFSESDREFLRQLIWKVAEFSGVQIVTYAILSNHFHVLVHIPKTTEVSDQEVLRRYCVLHSSPSKRVAKKIEAVTRDLTSNTPMVEKWRKAQLAQMGDVSKYMKMLKQRFTIGFNAVHGRFGTLWAERFKSVLVEKGQALKATAAYIDLNAVRAGMVNDPKDYRFSGYAEAIAGNEAAQHGIASALDASWADASSEYRVLLYGIGSNEFHKGAALTQESFKQVLSERGKLAANVILQCKQRFITFGAVLGSEYFVSRQIKALVEKYGRSRGLEPCPIPCIGSLDTITALRGLRRRVSPR